MITFWVIVRHLIQICAGHVHAMVLGIVMQMCYHQLEIFVLFVTMQQHAVSYTHLTLPTKVTV